MTFSMFRIVGPATLGLVLTLPSLDGEQLPGSTPRPGYDAQLDAKWEALSRSVDERLNLPVPINNGSQHGDKAEDQSSTGQRVSVLRQEATRLREFSDANPGNPKTAKARQREAVLLFEAAFMGDDLDKVRREQLAVELSTSKSLPVTDRQEVAAYSRNLKVHRSEESDPEKRLDAYESVARSLARDFPDVAINYESLLQIAKSRRAAGGLQLAHDLIEMPAPTEIKRQAEIHAARCELVGKPLVELCGDGIAAWPALSDAKGRAVIIYSWSASMPWTFDVVQRLVALAPKQTVIFGLNLDDDAEAAAKFAQKGSLPGVQAYSVVGAGGRLYEALLLSQPGLVYVADEHGMVVSISASDAYAQFADRRSNP